MYMSKRGFTLIELLVVISIVSFLSSVILASLNSARAKARDAKRLQDLTQIRTALTMYYTDNGVYPSSSGAWRGNCSGYGGYPTSGSTGYIPNLAPTYISVLPVDPKPIGTGNCYLYRSVDGNDYMFLIYLTVEKTLIPSLYRPTEIGSPSYAVYSAGGASY
jgi:prepilin-type N-terminal cleavage/methylation domain-containing protein